MHKGHGFAFALTMTAMLIASVPAHASIVGTEHLVTQHSRATTISRIEGALAGETVAAQLEAWGVAPEMVSQRLAALSEMELQRLADEMESDPAGAGALAVVGGVFVVLIVLELLGITNIFRRR